MDWEIALMMYAFIGGIVASVCGGQLNTQYKKKHGHDAPDGYLVAMFFFNWLLWPVAALIALSSYEGR